MPAVPGIVSLLLLCSATRSARGYTTECEPQLFSIAPSPKFWTASPADPANVSGLLRARGWERTTRPHEAQLAWAISTKLPDVQPGQQPIPHVNHLTNEDSLTNFGKLLVHLRAYDRAHPHAALRLDDFMQPTVRLSRVDECLAFFENVACDSSLWVFKPTGRNGGRGIYLVNRSDSAAMLAMQEDESCCGREALRRYRARLPTPARNRAHAQRYAHHPVLLDGHYKCSVRSYILVASADPLRVYFHPGRVRRARLEYNLVDPDAYVVASTKSTDSGASFEVFLDAMAQQLNTSAPDVQQCAGGSVHEYARDCVLARLQQIATRTINATHAAWRVSQSGAFFLGGLDTMWDVQGRAYVTEVQGDPGHGMPHALWRETTQRVVGGALDIVLATVTVDAERSMTRLDGWQLLIDLGRMPHYYAAP